ncbi:MAG: aldolase/citrate lyase family protein [Desulfurococcaceae archaeon]
MVVLPRGRAYENLEEIVSFEGITGVFVGPSDLSASLGMYGKIESEEFIDTLADIARRAKTYRKLTGLMAHTLSIARKAVELGYNFISLAHDTKFLMEGAKMFLSEFKK